MPQLDTKNIAWQRSEYAQQLFAAEHDVLELAMRQAVGPSTLQIGGMLDESVVKGCDLPFLIRSSFRPSNTDKVVDMYSDPAFLPFAPESFSTVAVSYTHLTLPTIYSV